MTTTPTDLVLAKEAGSITVDLSFIDYTTGTTARGGSDGFLNVPDPGTATQFTVSYEANTEAAPRIDTLTITPVGSFYAPAQKFVVIQLGTDTEVHIGELILDSAEAITADVQALKHIIGSLRIGDGEPGDDITNTALAELSLKTITGALTISGTKLDTLDAFSELTTIEDSLVIRENALLDSLLGFTELRSIGNGLASEETPLVIEDNGTLSLCCGVSYFVQASLSPSYTLGGNGMPHIEGNAMGCASEEEAREACTHTISLSTTTSDVEIGAESGGTISISLPADGTEAVFTVALGIATGFTAEEASDEDNFVTFSVSGEVLTISYSANPGTTPRTAAITLSTEGIGASITRTLSLTQIGAISHTISLSTTTDGVVLGTDDGSTINISLPADGTEAIFAIDIGAGATGWTAMEVSDEDNFVSTVTDMGSDEESLTISYLMNEGTSSRTATITLSTEGPGASITRTLSLTQRAAGAPTLSLTTVPSGLADLSAAGGAVMVNITIGGSASGWMASTAADFVTFSAASGVGSGSLTLTYAANGTTEARSGMVIISTTGGGGTAATETLSLTQVGADLASTFGVSRTEDGLVLYPNPVSGRLHIGGLQERTLVRISTLGGRIVRRAPVSASSSSIDVSDLRGGAYVVVIESSKAVLSRRLVIIE